MDKAKGDDHLTMSFLQADIGNMFAAVNVTLNQLHDLSSFPTLAQTNPGLLVLTNIVLPGTQDLSFLPATTMDKIPTIAANNNN